jgi:hypothetical protein
MTEMPTMSDAIREKCKQCLGIEGSAFTYDCLSEGDCPLYAAHRFIGTPQSASRSSKTVCHVSEHDRELSRRGMKKRRPSKAIIAAMCRQCNPDDQDCTSRDIPEYGAEACPLLPWTPFQPGGQPKNAISPEMRERLLRAYEKSPLYRDTRASSFSGARGSGDVGNSAAST